MSVAYNSTIEKKILGHLDGWIILTPPNDDSTNNDVDIVSTEDTESETIESIDVTENIESTNDDTNCNYVDPFITDFTDYKNNPNKRVLSCEVERFYNEALTKAYMITNRLNVNDLTTIEESFFIDAVCLLTASDLWNKYNIRVNNEDLEDTYVQSYGGLLYNQAMKTLQPFINQRIYTSTSIKAKQDNSDINNSDVWG